MKIKKNVFVVFFIFVGSFLFAENWFVCLSSFKSQENAENFYTLLSNNDLNSWIYFSRTEKGDFYRVLYSEPCDDIEKAHDLCNKINSSEAAKKLELKGLWVCKAQKEALVPEIAEPELTDIKEPELTEPEIQEIIEPTILTTQENLSDEK